MLGQYNFLGYADDCALLSPSREALQRMVDICERYFSFHGIKISVDNIVVEKSKTKCLAFNVNCEPSTIRLYDIDLPWVASAKHLGHLIHVDESSSHDILKRRGGIYRYNSCFKTRIGGSRS